MLRCASQRLVSPSLRGASPMLGMFWLPFSDILGQSSSVLKAWSDVFIKRLATQAKLRASLRTSAGWNIS